MFKLAVAPADFKSIRKIDGQLLQGWSQKNNL